MPFNRYVTQEEQDELVEKLNVIIEERVGFARQIFEGEVVFNLPDVVATSTKNKARENVVVGVPGIASPLEWAGFRVILLLLTNRNPFFVKVYAPGDVAKVDEWIEQQAQFHESVSNGSGLSGLSNAITLLLNNSDQTDNDAFIQEFLGFMPELPNTFHIVMQYDVPGVKVDDQGVRVDMLVIVPEQNLKIVFEFDGYTYHSGRKPFVSDRKRDRILQDKGYKVRRYASDEFFTPAKYFETAMQIDEWIQELCERGGQEVYDYAADTDATE